MDAMSVGGSNDPLCGLGMGVRIGWKREQQQLGIAPRLNSCVSLAYGSWRLLARLRELRYPLNDPPLRRRYRPRRHPVRLASLGSKNLKPRRVLKVSSHLAQSVSSGHTDPSASSQGGARGPAQESTESSFTQLAIGLRCYDCSPRPVLDSLSRHNSE